MSRAIIGPGAEGLSDEDLGAALAWLGTEGGRFDGPGRYLWRWFRVRPPITRGELEAAADQWRKRADGKINLHVLGDRSDWAPWWYAYHFDPQWLVDTLRAAPDVDAVSFATSVVTRAWDWPLDVGVLGVDPRVFQQGFDGAIEERFVALYDARLAPTKLDLLLFPGSLSDLFAEKLRGLSLSEVHTVLALGGVGIARDPLRMLHALRVETEAAVVGALSVARENQARAPAD